MLCFACPACSYNRVDSGAKVFKLVENDDLAGLMTLFVRGEASMRDCDEAGRSLLSVSLVAIYIGAG